MLALITTMLSCITTTIDVALGNFLENHGVSGLTGDDQRSIVELLDYSSGSKLQEMHFSCASWSRPQQLALPVDPILKRSSCCVERKWSCAWRTTAILLHSCRKVNSMSLTA
jgi:hypothetical protein